MTTEDAERLEALRAAVARLRFVTLLAGGFVGLYALFGAVTTVGQLWVLVDMATNAGSAAPYGMFFLAGSVLSAITCLMDAVAAGLLLGSGVRGLQARTDPGHLLGSARLLKWFWWLVLLRLLAMIGSLVVQMLLPLAMF